MSRSAEPTIAQALEAYVTADTPEAADRAWSRIALLIRGTEDVRIIADVARAAHRAHVKAVDELKQLVAAIEGGPNPLLPVVMALGGNSYVVSHGRGQYNRVGAMVNQETAEPILTPEEFEARGPCIAALDPNGSLIVEAYWHDENPDLFAIIVGQDEGRIEGIEDDFDGWLPSAERIGLPLEAEEAIRGATSQARGCASPGAWDPRRTHVRPEGELQ